MSTCFGCEIQTVYSCLNRTEVTENRHQKLKTEPNRTNLNRASRNGPCAVTDMLSYSYHIIVLLLHHEPHHCTRAQRTFYHLQHQYNISILFQNVCFQIQK